MELSEVKTNLNAVVIYNDTAYIFKGCTIRKDTKTNEIFYQAELADIQLCKIEKKQSGILKRLSKNEG